MLKKNLGLIACVATALGLAGCSDIYVGGGSGPVMYPGQVQSAPVWGVEEGSVYAAGFTNEDRRRIADAAGAVLRPDGPKAAQWGPTTSGRSGGVSAGAPFLIGLDSIAGARIAAPANIQTRVPLGAATGTYRAEKNVNVRAGPSTDTPVIRSLASGTLVRAFGAAQPEDWLLVGRSDEIFGYVYAPLLTSEGDSDPILAGGAPRAPRLCRDLMLSLRASNGQKDNWSVVVCQRTDGSWEVSNTRGLS